MGQSKKNEDWRTESNGPGGIAQYLRAELSDVTSPWGAPVIEWAGHFLGTHLGALTSVPRFVWTEFLEAHVKLSDFVCG